MLYQPGNSSNSSELPPSGLPASVERVLEHEFPHPLASPVDKDAALRALFPRLLGELAFTDVMVLADGRRAPRTLGEYSLAPIISSESATHATYYPAQYDFSLPRGVQTNYKTWGSRPYVDTGLAVGLVYKDELTALAAAAVNHDGALMIKQLQAVTMKAHDPGTKYKTGLHSGILWRDTLVRTWTTIAERMSMSHIGVQAGANNTWDATGKVSLATLIAGYDEVAKRMGFSRDPSSRDWLKRILPK